MKKSAKFWLDFKQMEEKVVRSGLTSEFRPQSRTGCGGLADKLQFGLARPRVNTNSPSVNIIITQKRSQGDDIDQYFLEDFRV